MRILIVEDDVPLRSMLRALLKAEGHRVAEAGDGSVGLRALRAGAFDLLLCDLFMPGLDGLETLRDVRRDFPGLPVVSMSGVGLGGLTDLLGVARLLGASQTLRKPFSREELLAAIGRAAPAPSER
jgi:CheY-like chemotaxis protein